MSTVRSSLRSRVIPYDRFADVHRHRAPPNPPPTPTPNRPGLCRVVSTAPGQLCVIPPLRPYPKKAGWMCGPAQRSLSAAPPTLIGMHSVQARHIALVVASHMRRRRAGCHPARHLWHADERCHIALTPGSALDLSEMPFYVSTVRALASIPFPGTHVSFTTAACPVRQPPATGTGCMAGAKIGFFQVRRLVRGRRGGGGCDRAGA